MTFPVVLKFKEKLPEYLMSLGDPQIPFGGVIEGPDSETARNVPRYEDITLFKRCQPLQGTLTHHRQLHIAGKSIPTEFTSPYPMELGVICLCEYCLKYMGSDYTLRRHRLKCKSRAPPGNEIYRDGDWSFWEVDGSAFKVYCQNVCLLAKLFLESKTLYYDVEPFNFYILTQFDGLGYKFVGYFSKQKIYCGQQREQQMNNVSCIMVLPLVEYRGLGQLLIDFSYLLTRAQMATGTPEKPLSNLGSRSYETYWQYAVSACLLAQNFAPISIRDISMATRMTLNDVIYTLEVLKWLGDGKLKIDAKHAAHLVQQWEERQPMKLTQEKLVWSP